MWDGFKAEAQKKLDVLWAPPPPVVEPDISAGTYVIASGDTFWAIARKLNIPLSTLLELNPSADPYNLHIGQVIKVVEEEVSYLEHKIVAGDNFWALSRKYNTTVPEIMAMNPGVDPYQLQIGQLIRIPKQ